MTESEYARKLRAAVKARFGGRCVFLKIHGGPRQEAGISDLLLCAGGRFIAIELKQLGNRPTTLQSAFLKRVYQAGGASGVVFTNESLSVICDLIGGHIP